MRVTDETKANAQAVLDYILAHPEKHSQRHVVGLMDSSWNFFLLPSSGESVEDIVLTEENFCGTTMCIAGTVIFLNQGIDALNRLGKPVIIDDESHTDWEIVGAEYLGLDLDEADSIFFEMSNSRAIDLLIAIANGDEEKFHRLANYGCE